MSNISGGIFCRTYHKDADRLELLLRSIEKFCHNFGQVVIATPPDSIDAIRMVTQKFPFAELRPCNFTDNDYIGQQITKLTANRYIETDYITHIDSDCIFTAHLSPNDLLAGTLPILYHAPYQYFYENKIHMPWQSVTSQFAGRQVNHEFMRTFPLTYPRELYNDLAHWYQKLHGDIIDHIDRKIHGDHFSEFNLMGAFSYYSREKQYHQHLNVLKHTNPKNVLQFCLYDSRHNRAIEPNERDKIELILSSSEENDNPLAPNKI